MSQSPIANTSKPSSDDEDMDMDWELIPTANTPHDAIVPAGLDFVNINGNWMDDGDSLMFKATLLGTKMEDLKIETDEDGKFLKLSKALPPAGFGEGDDETVKWVLKECSSDSGGRISRSFKFPEGVIVKPNEFKAWMEEEDGVLNVAFTKVLKRSKKKIMSKALRVLAKAVPVILVIVSIVDEMIDDN